MMLEENDDLCLGLARRASQVSGKAPSPRAPGVLILSEAVSCSAALRGSVVVNPWQVQAVADAMADAVIAEVDDRTAWHEVSVCVDAHTYSFLFFVFFRRGAYADSSCVSRS